MSLIGKIQTLFSDKDKTKPVFPRTKVSAVSDDDGVGLDVILSEIKDSVIIHYVHSATGLNSNNTTVAAVNGKFKAYDTIELNVVNVNGITYNVNVGSVKLTKDSWYMFFLDRGNHTIHFLSSSGVSSEDFSAFYITYNSNGGTLPLDAVTNFGQTTASFLLPEPTKIGYTFKGWYNNAEFTGNVITQVIQGTKKDLEFYAKWEVNSYTYNIVYKSSSGTQLGTATVTYNYNTTNSISPKAFTGYTSPSAQSIKWDSVNAKTITFTYTPIKYTITYNLNGGALPNTAVTSYTIEDTVTLPTPSLTNGTFLGWCLSSNYTDVAVTKIKKGSTGNKTYYAKWKRVYANTPVHLADKRLTNGKAGSTYSSDDWSVMGWYDVSGIKNIILNNTKSSSQQTGICYFYTSKSYSSYISEVKYDTTKKGINQTIEVPSNAKYMLVNVRTGGTVKITIQP